MLQDPDLSFGQICRRKRRDRLAQILLLAGAGAAAGRLALAAARLSARLLFSQTFAGSRWLLPAVPLVAACAAAARMRMRVGGDIADVLAAQSESSNDDAEREAVLAGAESP